MLRKYSFILIFCFFSLFSCTKRSSAQVIKSDVTLQSYQKVAVLFAPAVHALLVLNQADTIIAIAQGVKRDRFILNYFPRLKSLPVIKHSEQIYYETLLTLKPDLIIGNQVDQNNTRLQGIVKKLDIPFFVYQPKPGSLEAVKQLAFQMGVQKAFNKIDAFNHSIAQLIPDTGIKKTQCYFSVLELERVLGQSERGWLVRAGFDVIPNSGSFVQSGKCFINGERLFALNPEWIFLIERAAYDRLTTEKRWRCLKAVKSNQIQLMPIGFSRWGHPNSIEFSLASLYVASVVHPIDISHQLLVEKTAEFYSLFLPDPMTADEAQRLLNRHWDRLRKKK